MSSPAQRRNGPPSAQAKDAEGVSTRERLLSAAEELFAQRGIDGVSLREITAAAGANVASAAYHFGTKDELIDELFSSRARAVADMRMDALHALKADPARPPALEDLLRAFLRPAVELGSSTGGQAFIRMRARLAFEPSETRRAVLGKAFDASSREYVKAIAAALPAVPLKEVYWRFHFVLGAMVYTMAVPGRIESISGGKLDTSNGRKALDKLVEFAAAGLRGPGGPTAA